MTLNTLKHAPPNTLTCTPPPPKKNDIRVRRHIPQAFLMTTLNVTGSDLLPATKALRKALTAAFKKALGRDINATLLVVSDADGAMEPELPIDGNEDPVRCVRAWFCAVCV